MTVLVLDGTLLGDALEQAGDEDVIVVERTASALEHLEHETADPRVFYLIGDREVIPLPDCSVDSALGGDGVPELGRVLR